LTYESPEYDPSATTFHEQEADMMDSWVNIKVSGDCHPKRCQVCSLRQKEAEIKNSNLNISLVKSEMRHKAGIDAATLAKNWGIGLEAAKRTRPVTTQRGIRRMIHPSLTER
jgi:hypothetical protein